MLLDSGFTFRYPTLDAALSEIAARTPRGLLPVTLG
jgi:NAD dependent epimerase/dehydratase family enzyme